MLAELNAVKSRLESLNELAAFRHAFDYKKATNVVNFPVITYEIVASVSETAREKNSVGISVQMKDTDKANGVIAILEIAELIRNSFLKNRVLGNKIAVDISQKIEITPDITIPHPFFECGILLHLITDIVR